MEKINEVKRYIIGQDILLLAGRAAVQDLYKTIQDPTEVQIALFKEFERQDGFRQMASDAIIDLFQIDWKTELPTLEEYDVFLSEADPGKQIQMMKFLMEKYTEMKPDTANGEEFKQFRMSETVN